MSHSRVRLAARLAVVENFRQEQRKQELSLARHACADAKERQSAAALRHENAEALRASTSKAHGLDVPNYLLYGRMCDITGQELACLETSVTEAAAEVTQKNNVWMQARARHQASSRRSERLADEHKALDEKCRLAEAIESWLICGGAFL